jgi:hypothetical protein
MRGGLSLSVRRKLPPQIEMLGTIRGRPDDSRHARRGFWPVTPHGRDTRHQATVVMRARALFLDRDGVINVGHSNTAHDNRGYIRCWRAGAGKLPAACSERQYRS